jgi:hypothetical protein
MTENHSRHIWKCQKRGTYNSPQSKRDHLTKPQIRDEGGNEGGLALGLLECLCRIRSLPIFIITVYRKFKVEARRWVKKESYNRAKYLLLVLNCTRPSEVGRQNPIQEYKDPVHAKQSEVDPRKKECVPNRALPQLILRGPLVSSLLAPMCSHVLCHPDTYRNERPASLRRGRAM